MATDQMAQSAVATSTVRVGNPPVAAFTASSTNIMVGDSVTFANNSTGTPPLQFQWNFGDGDTTAVEAPAHTFAIPGIFEVVLTAQNDFGSDSASTTIQVNPAESEDLSFDAFSAARSIIYWHEGHPEPADYWIFGVIDFPDEAGLDALIGDLTFRVEIAGAGDNDTVSLVDLDGGLSFHERYSTDIAGQEIRDVFIHPVSNDQAIFVIAGQFLLPGIDRHIQPPDVVYQLSLPATVAGETVQVVGSTVVTHQARSNIWVYQQ
jgi:PKD repeat protein